MGGLIRSINVKPFSWKETLIRIATGGFAASLAMLYLSTTTYPPTMQGFICGVVGILGTDLLNAVRIRMYKDITGEPPQQTGPDNDPPAN